MVYLLEILESGPSGRFQLAPFTGNHQGAAATWKGTRMVREEDSNSQLKAILKNHHVTTGYKAFTHSSRLCLQPIDLLLWWTKVIIWSTLQYCWPGNSPRYGSAQRKYHPKNKWAGDQILSILFWSIALWLSLLHFYIFSPAGLIQGTVYSLWKHSLQRTTCGGPDCPLRNSQVYSSPLKTMPRTLGW